MVNFVRLAGLVALAPLVAAMPASSTSPMNNVLERRAITCNNDDKPGATVCFFFLTKTLREPSVLYTNPELTNMVFVQDSDAVVCIDQLAARGDEPCRAEYTGAKALCTNGNAQIVAVGTKPGGTSAPW